MKQHVQGCSPSGQFTIHNSQFTIPHFPQHFTRYHFAVGSELPYYTPSKIFPFILAERPLLAIFHEKSSAVRIVRESGAGTVVAFTGNADLFCLVPFGLAGMINPPTSFVPELCVELWKALDTKDYLRAVEAQKKVDTAARLVAAELRKYGRVPLREVFRMRGFDVKRFPKWETEPMPKDAVAKLERELKTADIL